jgi:hypothetical protein
MGTSAHHVHGETPIWRERVNSAYAAPRRSLPAITNARRTPGIGVATTSVTADSHLPATAAVLIACVAASLSISGEWPRTPTRIRFAGSGAASEVRRRGLVPVTCSTSEAKASAATRTVSGFCGAT